MSSEKEQVFNASPLFNTSEEINNEMKNDDDRKVVVEYVTPIQHDYFTPTIASTSIEEDEGEKIVSDVVNEEASDDVAPKPSRELKLLLALSKEANLETNIAHKRKSVEPPSKSEIAFKRRNSTGSSCDSIMSTKTNHSDELHDSHNLKAAIDDHSMDEFKSGSVDSKETKDKEGVKSNKKLVGGAVDENGIRTRNLSGSFITFNNEKKDVFCWQCHHEGCNVFCKSCPRSFHQKCLRQHVSQPNHWLCPECVIIMQAENLKQRSSSMKNMTLVHLCVLLKFAMKRMLQVSGCEPFIHPVNENDFPNYKRYIIHPMDVTCLENNIKRNVYGSPQAFEADAKWILHNSIIFNSYQSKLTSIAKSMMKICKQEMAEIENCATCYLNANTKKKTWFIEVCPKPHILVWAKLKGFPFWPAKAMRSNSSGMVDVRFFGAHDRAWVHYKECFLFSLKDPNSNKQKRNDIIESVKELQLYVENLKKVYGEFRYAPYRIQLEPDDFDNQLTIMLPTYPNKLKPRKSLPKVLKPNGTTPVDEDDSKDDEEQDSNNESSSDESGNEDNISIATHKKNLLDASSNKNNARNHLNDSKATENRSAIIRGSNVRMRGGVTNLFGKIKLLPKFTLENKSKKRLSTESIETPSKIIRVSTDHSNNRSRSSSTDNINRLDNSDMKDTTGGNSENEAYESDSSTVPDTKPKSVVHVSLGENQNSEVTITTPTKSKISDQLMKKLSEPENIEITETAVDSSTPTATVSDADILLEKFKNKGLTVLERITELSPDIEIFETNNEDDNVDDNDNLAKDEECDNITTEVDLEDKDDILNPQEISSISDSVEDATVNDVSESPVVDKSDHLGSNVMEDKNNELHEEIESSGSIKESVVTSTSSEELINLVEKEIKNDIILETLDSTSTLKESTNDNEEVCLVSPTTGIIEKSKISLTSSSVIHANSEVESISKPTHTTESENESEISSLQRDLLTVVSVEDIKKKNLDDTSQSDISTTPSILENRLSFITKISRRQSTLSDKDSNSNIDNDSSVIVVKSEPSSEDEPSDSEYLEKKRKYLSALNISEKMPEKPKQHEIRTRSKTEEKKFKIVDNISKVIDDVATHYSITHANDEITITRTPKRKEIFIKPLASLQDFKQRARKSFPTVKNVYPSSKKDVLKVCKSITSPVITAKSAPKAAVVSSKPIEICTNKIILTPSVNSSLLPPNQPITYTTSAVKPVLSIIQNPISSNLFIPSNSLSSSANFIKISESQYVSQNNTIQKSITISSIAKPVTTPSSTITPTSTITSLPIVASVTANSEHTTQTNNLLDEVRGVAASVPEHVSRAINDIMNRTPPKLKPRPPGPLSTQFSEGIPSTAGNVTSKINSISHRLNDYFRGMLIELLNEVGYSPSPEADITKLKLENEELKHRHAEEILEIKKNISSILKDMQKSLMEEKERAVEETRTACELESVKRVEDAKSKQWCANCSKEAQFYCCWNTSYCDYPCQQKHWPAHMSKCTQQIQNMQLQNSVTSPSTMKSANPQPLVLRQTTAPKGFKATIIGKSTKVLVNRPTSINKVPFSFARTTPGNHITLVESTPGNYELLGSAGPISVGGKIIANIGKLKNSSMLSVNSSPNVDLATGSVKQGFVTPTLTNSVKPTNTISESKVTELID